MEQRGRAALWALFLLSGLAGLVYQVVWFRMLALVFGNTLLATSTVLSVFFAGLALGSFFFGRLADRISRRILAYGLLEAGIGVYALVFPVLLQWAGKIGSSVNIAAESNSPFFFIRTLSCALLLLPPTFLMGGTFPLLARQVIEDLGLFGKRFSLLYFMNTAGAVLGSLLAGFILIEAFGIRMTVLIAALLNFLIFAGSLWLQGSVQPSRVATDEPPDADPAGSTFVLTAAFLTGMVSLVYEVVWTRVFTSYFGSSVYSFSSIVAAFLVGIALGSVYFSKRYADTDSPLGSFGEIQLRIAMSVVLFLILFMKLPVATIWAFRHLDLSFAGYQSIQFALLLIAMLYTTLNMGASFPAINAAYVDRVHSLGRKTGRVYAFNTAGGIVGAALTGFVLIPHIGTEFTLWGAFFLNLLLGVIALLRARSMTRLGWTWAAATLLIFFMIPRWDQGVLISGLYATAYAWSGKEQDTKYRNALPESIGTQLLRTSGISHSPPRESPLTPMAPGGVEILFFKDGMTSTISVIQDHQGFRSLLINGKADASTNPLGDMRTQLLLGHLPVILSRAMPRSALVIGLGSGTTLSSIEQYPIPGITSVEIEPVVVDVARRYFSSANRNALNDPRLKLYIADARTLIANLKERYDVITSEPSNLWMAGCSNLFTREFFQSASDRLTPGGIMCQWIHLYQISPDDIRIFLRTYHSVFPHVSIWVDKSDMLALGSNQPILIDPALIARRLALPQISEHLAPSGLNSIEGFLPILVADTKMVERFSAGAPINRDDRPILEFSAPKSLLVIRANEIVHNLMTGEPYKH